MRIFLIVSILTLVVQNSHAFEPGSEESARHFFTHYLDSYNANDPVAASQKYAETVTLTGIQDSVLMSSREGMKTLLARFLTNLKEKGVVRYEWEILQVRMLGKNTALASNVAVRYKADNTVYDKAAATLIASHSETGWKIVSLNIHSPDQILPLDQ